MTKNDFPNHRQATLAQFHCSGFETRLLGAALDYAAEGKPVFPCRANKKPFTKTGFMAATTDADQIRAWWAGKPNAMIGIPTGSVSDLIVLDVDVKMVNGFRELKKRGLDHFLDIGRYVNTPSGGAHIWIENPRSATRNSAGKIAPGVDIRGNGGYVIAPPSRPDPAKPGYEFLFEGGV